MWPPKRNKAVPMAAYEVVREIQNRCAGSQMRDVFFDEVETDDPVAYVRALLASEDAELTLEAPRDADSLTIHASCHGLNQRFIFTRL